MADKVYKVEIGFCGRSGVSRTYTVAADSVERAKAQALGKAHFDLSVEAVICEEDDFEQNKTESVGNLGAVLGRKLNIRRG